MADEDIREVIRIDEEQKEAPTQEAGEEVGEEFLTPEEVEARLKSLRGKVPTFIINDLLENLSGRSITRDKLEKIIDRVITAYYASSGGESNVAGYISELNRKIEMLASQLREMAEARAQAEVEEEVEAQEEQEAPEPNHTREATEAVRELPPEQALFAGTRKEETRKPRLSRIPEDVLSIMIAMKWLEFLIEKVGITNLPEVLEFYSDLGWISEEVVTKLLKYARGTKPFHQDLDWKPEDKLTARDHMLSLLFIERLRGRKISKDLLIKLEREVQKIKAGAEEIYGV